MCKGMCSNNQFRGYSAILTEAACNVLTLDSWIFCQSRLLSCFFKMQLQICYKMKTFCTYCVATSVLCKLLPMTKSLDMWSETGKRILKLFILPTKFTQINILVFQKFQYLYFYDFVFSCDDVKHTLCAGDKNRNLARYFINELC